MPLYSFSDKFEVLPPYLVKQVAKELNIEFKSNYYMADMHEEIVYTLKDKTISLEHLKILDIDSEILRTYAKNNNIPYLKHKAKDRLPGYIVYAYYDKDDVARYYGERFEGKSVLISLKVTQTLKDILITSQKTIYQL